jgi:hypothetical protein
MSAPRIAVILTGIIGESPAAVHDEIEEEKA